MVRVLTREIEVARRRMVRHDGVVGGIKWVDVVVCSGSVTRGGGDVVGVAGSKWTRLAGDNFLAVMSCATVHGLEEAMDNVSTYRT